MSMIDVSAALHRARESHARGDLSSAIFFYESVLQAEPRNYPANYFLAVALYQSGQLKKSIRFFDAAAAADSRRLEAHRDRGLVLLKLKEFAAAEASFANALRLDPRQPELHVNRGIALNRLGRVDQSIESYRAALALKPGMAEAHHNLGNSLAALGRAGEALSHFGRAVETRPGYAEAWLGAGNVLLGLDRTAEALEHFRKVLEINPNHADALHAIARALIEQNHAGEAEAALARALEIDPGHAGALLTRAKLRQGKGKPDEALADYDSALAIMPTNVEALVGKGGILRRRKRLDEAIALYDRAIALEPNNAQAYSGIGRIFLYRKEFVAAAKSFDAAIMHEPDVATHHYWRGQSLRHIGYYEDALSAFERAMKLKPGFAPAYLSAASIYSMMNYHEEALATLEDLRRHMPGEDLYAGRRFVEKMSICVWADAEAELTKIVREIEADKLPFDPLSALHYLDSPALQRRCAELSVTEDEKWSLPPNKPAVITRDSRITVGYYSADFRQHAMMVLISGLLELHDRERFRLVAFSLRKDQESERRKRVVPYFEAFHDVDHMLDREIIALSRQENIHVAVDLMGFTQFGRPTLFMAGLAPIQVNKQGFPGTMGTSSMDYIIADPVLIPEDMRSFYCEKVAYLPNSYQPNDRKRRISDRVFTREELGLPAGAFVFCCFNKNFKISPDVFATWMRILKQAPGSVLWLLAYSKTVSKNLREAARSHGVDPERIVFAKPLPLAEHLARHRAADLFLDTLPYNAHTTASDALWAGLPVLTRMGQPFASRVGASLLKAAGLPELITTSAEDYEQLALRLYRDRATLAALRQRLAANRLTCPLFDTERYARDLETLYSQMIDRHERGLPPEHLFV
jgi:predicted O-linked N-acetylglucosamine transferase (SPINDLY family)